MWETIKILLGAVWEILKAMLSIILQIKNLDIPLLALVSGIGTLGTLVTLAATGKLDDIIEKILNTFERLLEGIAFLDKKPPKD